MRSRLLPLVPSVCLLAMMDCPMSAPPSDYPIQVAPDGILVDDPGLDGTRVKSTDIVEGVVRSIWLIWPERRRD